MIFVILAIVILVFSFIIALASLIREQGKLSKQTGEEEAESALAASGLKKAQTIPGGKPSVLQPEVAQRTGAPASDVTAGRPLFPWEEGKYKPDGSLLEEDKKKVEVLRAQLAELKEKAQAGKAEKTVVDVKEDKYSEKPAVLSQGKLSGEISIGDLKKE